MTSPRGGSADQQGFTLIELLVGMLISSVLAGILLSIIVSSQQSAAVTTTQADLTAEARTALNRISEDLQQAVPLTQINPAGSATPTTPISAITAVTNPDGPSFQPGAVTSFTFNADFAGAGCVSGLSVETQNILPLATASPCPASSPDPSSPDTETVCWGGTADPHLYLVSGAVNPGTCQPASGSAQPLLSGKVSGFEAFYRSSLYRYDTNHDGITEWYELDSAGPPVGNNDGLLDAPELGEIDDVELSISMAKGTQTESYQTNVDLRNVS